MRYFIRLFRFLFIVDDWKLSIKRCILIVIIEKNGFLALNTEGVIVWEIKRKAYFYVRFYQVYKMEQYGQERENRLDGRTFDKNI